MILETERLVLRRWEESDAEDLYKYASDPDVGPITGWPPHQNVEESRNIIKTVFTAKEAYAICLKSDNRAIGAIELRLNGHTKMTDREDECELGYWLGKSFWGQGLMTEAAKEMLRHAFEDINMMKVWCGYYDGNMKSKRVQEKCGFRYQWTAYGIDVPLMHEKRTEHVNSVTKEEWAGKQTVICQCCGMPLSEDSLISREPDGSYNEDYCQWCYANGEFVYKSKASLLDYLVSHMPNPDNMEDNERRIQFDSYISQLKHWK